MNTLMSRHELSLKDIDAVEINEAFAVQVLSCLEALDSKEYCHVMLGLEKPWGALDFAKLNMQGGAIAAGHPVGASGARIVLHNLMNMKQKGLKRGISSICIGGGLGGAMLLEGYL